MASIKKNNNESYRQERRIIKMKKLTRQEIIDILYGCTIVGTGGGGDLQLGLDLMV